ncbi:hypothetical protein Clacol_007466 [Clathrus columnatus]|uniref:SH3 domain-containing protein n=1 Tax=Clathrus columnatus TaxID=1419009 RepID=A0AAV5AFX2_9AGAM|nr:hypothetical protein Clacol_007466 [Clathrus columnatus]
MAIKAVRGSEGYDFTPILTHYVFLLTTILAIAGWFIAFIGQIVTQASNDPRDSPHTTVGVLWFAIFLQLALILGVIHTLATDSVALHRFQISIFGAISLTFAVFGVNQGIFTNIGSLEAMAAGWLLLSIVNILWLIYFTSEEGSLSLHLFNLTGTGGLTGPGRNGFRSARRTNSHLTPLGVGMSGGHSGGIGNGHYTSTMQDGGGMRYDTKETDMGMGMGIGGGGNAMDNSFNTANREGAGVGNNPTATSIRTSEAPTSPRSSSQPINAPSNVGGDGVNPTTPLMDTNPIADGESGSHQYRAKALYGYTASPDDPNEISFTKGEILEILDKTGKWWHAKRADGTTGIAPSIYYLLPFAHPPTSLPMPTNIPLQTGDKNIRVQTHSSSPISSMRVYERGFDVAVDETIETESPTNSSQELLKARRESVYSRRSSMRRNSVNSANVVVVDMKDRVNDSLLDIPLAVAIIPPLGTLLIGGDFFKDFLLLLLMFFYLHQLIKIPWDLYLASRPRVKRLDPVQISDLNSSIPPELRNVCKLAASELRIAEIVFLTLSVLSPLLGAALLRYVCTALTGRDYISWFSTGLFVLITGVRPWGHLTRRLKERTEDLQETIEEINEYIVADDDDDDDDDERSVLTRIQELEDIVTVLKEKLESKRSKSDMEGLKNEMDESLNIVDAALEKVVSDIEHQFQTMNERIGRLESVVRKSLVKDKRIGNLGKIMDERICEKYGKGKLYASEARGWVQNAPSKIEGPRTGVIEILSAAV